MKRNIATILALFALLCVVGHCVGCSPSPPVNDAARGVVEFSSYQHDLSLCIAEGKDAGSWRVYEDCAKKADERAGKKP